MAIVAVIVIALAGLLISFRITAWGRRTSQWMRDLASSAVAYQGARFSDFVGFAGFGLTVVTIALSWFTVNLQNEKSTVDTQIKDSSDHLAAESSQLRDMKVRRDPDYAPGIDIHLEAPVRDVHLIGQQIQFIWKYTKHTRNLSYRLELVKVGSSLMPAGPHEACDFRRFSSCIFYATQPTEQRSTLPLHRLEGKEDIDPDWEGKYLWRVVPAKEPSSAQQSSSGDGDPDVSDWSEFGSFDIYSSLMARMAGQEAASVLVGTAYSDNINFSTVNERGEQAGYDMDLVKLLVEGCMKRIQTEENTREISFDASECYKTVADYEDRTDKRNTFSPPRRPNQPRVEIVAFPSVNEGLGALTRKEIDIFIGSVTSAVQRENDGVLFTDGYYQFDTSLYAHQSSPRLSGAGETFGHWVTVKRSIGVIENSTNHWLATSLAAEASTEQTISIVAFPSYGELASAFERREVDGVLVDNVLGEELKRAEASNAVWEVSGLDQTSAWTEYHRRIGAEHEHFAIAVATEFIPMQGSRLEKVWRQTVKSVAEWMNQRNRPVNVGGLHKPLQDALAMVSTGRLKCSLEKSNSVPHEKSAKQCLDVEPSDAASTQQDGVLAARISK